MSDISKDLHAKLGCMVLRLFPKVMQTILEHYVRPPWLKMKYSKQDFRFVFTEDDVILMEKLPNIDEFSIEICYKILRYEIMSDEPKCKWGNFPLDTDVEITDDIQRLINATNLIISINSESVTVSYYEKLQKEIKLMVTRIDSFLKLKQDTLESIYSSLCRSVTDYSSILQDLTRVKAIKEYPPYTHSEKKERYCRLSAAIVDTLTDILRHVIGSEYSPSQLYQKSLPKHNHFSFKQQDNLRELQHSNTYDSLDISLIYKLLRQFSSIPAPTKGWGTNPDKADIQLGDDVERIRHYRNELTHRVNTNIDKSVFDNYFDNFRDIAKRMDFYFNQQTGYERQIIWQRTRVMNTELQTKYENAMKQLENIKLRGEQLLIKYYWGDSFELCLTTLRQMIEIEKEQGWKKIRLQIIMQIEGNDGTIANLLNSLKDDINAGLNGIEFINAEEGCVVMNVDLLLEMLVTDDKLHATLCSFIERVLECISTYTSENIDLVVIYDEEFPQWDKPKGRRAPVYIDFDIDAHLFESNDKMEEQLRNIFHAIATCSNGSGSNENITATLLPINLESRQKSEDVLTQAQTPVKYRRDVSVKLRHQFTVKTPSNEKPNFLDCIKLDDTLVFINHLTDQLILSNVDGTYFHNNSVYKIPYYLTDVDRKTVAVSCTYDKIIRIIDISSGFVTNTINIGDLCHGISYNGDYLYVVIGRSILHVMDLKGNVIRTLPLPSGSTSDITVDRDRLVCIDPTSIYCCSLDGKLTWQFDKYKNLYHVTTDNEGNVYVTNGETYSVVVVSDDGKKYREFLTESDGLDRPSAIYFDKKENILLVCNESDGKVFLFDVKV